jgi:hypothetical protein
VTAPTNSRLPGSTGQGAAPNNLGMAGLICGSVSIAIVWVGSLLAPLAGIPGVVLGLIGVIVGFMGRTRAAKKGGMGMGLATGGIVTGGTGIFLSIAFIIGSW